MAKQYVPHVGPVVTRADARAVGATHYFTGKACKRGHASLRSIQGNCMACHLLVTTKQARSNPDAYRAKLDAWQQANPERWREYKREWNRKNADKVREQNKARRIARRDAYRSYANNRRSKELAGGTHSGEDIKDIFVMQKKKCAYCRKRLPKIYHTDHIVPISKGGSNDRRNLQLTCQPCNNRKHAADPIDFARKIGLLI